MPEPRRDAHQPEPHFTCPQCGGMLGPDEEGASYACAVGHSYSATELPAQHAGAVQRALATALRLLDEHVNLLRALADDRERESEHDAAEELRGRAAQTRADADALWEAARRRPDAG